jgi:hypothetical protein
MRTTSSAQWMQWDHLKVEEGQIDEQLRGCCNHDIHSMRSSNFLLGVILQPFLVSFYRPTRQGKQCPDHPSERNKKLCWIFPAQSIKSDRNQEND